MAHQVISVAAEPVGEEVEQILHRHHAAAVVVGDFAFGNAGGADAVELIHDAVGVAIARDHEAVAEVTSSQRIEVSVTGLTM